MTAISARVAEPLGSNLPPFLPVKTPAAYISRTALRNSSSTAARSGMALSLMAGSDCADRTFANSPASSYRVMVLEETVAPSGQVDGRSSAFAA